jgi:flavin reductase (DIM6/NTAB) family NADH-FMN oxidoreductase RutF
MSPDPDKFRALVGTFATGCTVVTMEDKSQDYHGLTANAFSSVSLDPPLVLVCVDHDTESYERLESEEIDGYCINILSKSQKDLGEYFAGMKELAHDPFETRVVGDRDTQAPVFEQSLAYLDCSIHDSHVAGDHTIYIGKVEQADTIADESEPLTFYTGDWGTIAAD